MRKEEEGKSAKKSGKKEKETKQQKKKSNYADWFHGIVVREQLVETFFGKMNRGKGSDAFSSDRNLP